MSKISTITFTGKSATKYDFDVYDINTGWKDDVGVVYVVTKRYKKSYGKYYHDKIYIGRTEDLKERHSNHHQQDCFDSNSANCICIHMESNYQRQVDIETDLIQGNTTQCNDT